MNIKIILIICLIIPAVHATDNTCITYFTGVGCPHCAKTDPVILDNLTLEYNDLIIIEYEIYQEPENGDAFYDLASKYGSGFGIPNIVFNHNRTIGGDIPILQQIRNVLDNIDENPCPLHKLTNFEDLEPESIPGKPKIWSKDRVLIKQGNGDLPFKLLTGDIMDILSNKSYQEISPKPVQLSGSEIEFNNAVKINGWVFQWDRNRTSKNQKKQVTGQTTSIIPLIVYSAIGLVLIVSTIYILKWR